MSKNNRAVGRSTKPLMLALDIGTSSVRSSLFDERGRREEGTSAQKTYHLAQDIPGQAELAPATLLRATRQCLRKTLQARESLAGLRGRPVIGVGASCFWHSVLGVDACGEPLTPIYTWADARSGQQAARLRRSDRLSDLHARTGCVAHTSYWPAKLAWLRKQSAAAFGRVSYWVSPGEWLYWRLAGVRSTSHSMASGTGLYDPNARDYDEQVLAWCRVGREKLGPLDDTGLPASTGRSRKFVSGLDGALWFAAIGDGAAGNVGSGAAKVGTAAINLGSSAALRVVRSRGRAQAPEGLFAYRVDEQRYLLGGAISNAGNLIAWCTRELKLPRESRALESALAPDRTARHNLTVLPFWTAERAPTWRDDLSGCVSGLDQSTSALDILQAVTEAGFHRLAQIAERLPGLSARTEIVVSGGLSAYPRVMQRLADVLGRKLIACSEPEASLRGAAVHAWRQLGVDAPAPRGGRRYRPEQALVREYRAARRRQGELERLITGGG